MDNCHKATFWRKQARIFHMQIPEDYRAVLHLASLVLTNPIGWWTRRALRKAICVLLAQNSQVCFVQIVTNNAAHEDRAWAGLLHDKKSCNVSALISRPSNSPCWKHGLAAKLDPRNHRIDISLRNLHSWADGTERVRK